MTDETIPYEQAIRELTSAAHFAINAFGLSMDASTASNDYHSKFIEMNRKSSITKLSDPELLEGIRSENEMQKLFQLVSALLDAHLILYEAATEKMDDKENLRTINDCIRRPALRILQNGYSCLTFLEFAEAKSNMSELERLVRKGEANPASREAYVSQSIDLLKVELETRKRTTPKARPRSTKQTRRKVKAK